MKPLITLLLIISVLAACKPGRRETVAHITERRLAANGKLVIRYRFHTGTQWVADSMETAAATVIPVDSLPVVFSSENPSENQLRIP